MLLSAERERWSEGVKTERKQESVGARISRSAP